MNKAQDKAELRRKFYVALTRVKDRLILTGAPGNKASFNETTGLLSVRFAPDPRTMGRMLVEGLRRASWNAQTPAPWLSADEVEKDMLPLFSSNATETPFNPTSLLDGSPLGINGLAGLRVYHHPSCFETMTTHSPQQRVRALATHLERLGEASVEDATPLLLEENIKGAAHHLDATSSCARKYWLEHVKGWATEPFMLPNTSTKFPSLRPWPEPTTFGLMMHRVLEIGLRNPRAQRESTPPLEPSWMHESDDDLASSSTVGRVMNEFGYGLEQKPSSREATWRDRLMHLSALTDAGLLGRWVRGEEVNGWSVEAVRTELPFFHREVLARKESVEPPFRHTNGAVVHRVNMDFSGRADLVLALVDEQGGARSKWWT